MSAVKLISILTIFLTGLLAYPNATAQVGDSQLTSLELFRNAQSSFKERNYDNALSQLEKAALNLHIDSSYRAGRILHYQGLCLEKKGERKKALEKFQATIPFYRKCTPIAYENIVEAYRQSGITLRKIGDFDQASENYYLSLETALKNLEPNNGMIGKVYNSIGIFHRAKGELAEAEENYENALQIFIKAYGSEDPEVGRAYNNLGVIAKARLNMPLATEYYEKALEILEKSLGDKDISSLRIKSNLGGVYGILGDYERAKTYRRNTLETAIELFGEDGFTTAQFYSQYGNMLQQNGEFKTGLENLMKAKEIILSQEELDYKELYYTYGTIMNLFENSGEYEKAYEEGLKMEDLMMKTFGEKHPEIPAIRMNLANHLNKLNRADEALPIVKQSLNHPQIHDKFYKSGQKILAQTFGNLNELDSAIFYIEKGLNLGSYKPFDFSIASQSYTTPETVMEQLHLKGHYLRKKYEITGDIYFLRQSVRTGKETLAFFDYAKKNNLENVSILSITSYYYEYFADHIGNSIRLYEKSDSIKYLEEAFQTAEKSRNNLMAGTSNFKNYGDISTEFLKEENRLRAEIQLLERQNFEGEKNNKNLFEAKEKYYDFLEKLKINYPDYFNLKYSDSTASMNDIQSKIGKNESFLEFFVGEDSIYIFHLNHSNVEIVRVANDFELNEKIEKIRDGIYEVPKDYRQKNNGIDDFTSAAFSLFEKLLKPVSNLGEKLIIVPDGHLGYLPFDILLTEKPPKNSGFNSFPYLVKKHEISYNFSGTLWLEMMNREYNSNGLLAFAPKFRNSGKKYASIEEFKRNDLGNLFFNESEVEEISKLIGGNILKSTDASFQNLISAKGDIYDIFHFASHAKLNDKNPNFSFLAFNGADADADSSKMFLSDIYNLRLPANMIVLSACETGTGELKKGEGIISLGRGFTYAGAKSVVMSLWSVNDKSTSEIMISFYENLKKGLGKGASLRAAKLTYLENNPGESSSPFYWAPFVTYGDQKSLKFGNQNYWWWVIPILGFGLFGYFYRLKNKFS